MHWCYNPGQRRKKGGHSISELKVQRFDRETKGKHQTFRPSCKVKSIWNLQGIVPSVFIVLCWKCEFKTWFHS